MQATSPVQAKMHYQGKTHDKHVRNYFTSLNKLNNLNSAVPIPQKLSASGQKMGSEDEGRPQGLHCSICDLAFTSFSQVWSWMCTCSFCHFPQGGTTSCRQEPHKAGSRVARSQARLLQQGHRQMGTRTTRGAPRKSNPRSDTFSSFDTFGQQSCQ